MEIAVGILKHLICLSSLPPLCCISHSLLVHSVPEHSHIRCSCVGDWRSPSSGLWHHAVLYKFTMFLPCGWRKQVSWKLVNVCQTRIHSTEVNYLSELKFIVTKNIPYLLTVYELQQWLHTLYRKKYAWDHADEGDAAFDICILIQEWVFVVFCVWSLNVWALTTLPFVLKPADSDIPYGHFAILGGNLAHLWLLSCMSERPFYKVYDKLVHGVKELNVKLLIGVINAEVPWGWNWCTSLFIQN